MNRRIVRTVEVDIRNRQRAFVCVAFKRHSDQAPEVLCAPSQAARYRPRSVQMPLSFSTCTVVLLFYSDDSRFSHHLMRHSRA